MRKLLTSVVLYAGMLAGCSQTLQMTERLPTYTLADLNEIPIVLVGQVVEPASPAGPFHPARYDSNLVTRLYRIRVRVENVLKGNVAVGDLADLFLFVDNRNLGSSRSRRDLPKGSRQLLLLQRDYGRLRAIEDNFTSGFAVKVLSGPHPGLHHDPSKSIIEEILHILLSRGVDVSDKQMAVVLDNAPRYGIFGNEEVVRELQQIAIQETRSVGEVACSVVKEFGSSCNRVDGKPR